MSELRNISVNTWLEEGMILALMTVKMLIAEIFIKAGLDEFSVKISLLIPCLLLVHKKRRFRGNRVELIL